MVYLRESDGGLLNFNFAVIEGQSKMLQFYTVINTPLAYVLKIRCR